MAKHELTEKQIAALQKLGVANFGFYRAHIPISMNNIYFNTYGKAFDRLSKAIAVDVYTSPILLWHIMRNYKASRVSSRCTSSYP